MSEVTDAIQKLLDIKSKIDNKNSEFTVNMVSYDQWLVSAVSLLLRIELMNQKKDNAGLA